MPELSPAQEESTLAKSIKYQKYKQIITSDSVIGSFLGVAIAPDAI